MCTILRRQRRPQWPSRFLQSILICFVSLGILASSAMASGSDRAMWLSSAAPQVSRQLELPDNQEPLSTSTDCDPVTIPNGTGSISSCAYQTPFGKMANSYLLDGPNGAYPYEATVNNAGFVMPSVPGRPNMLVTAISPRTWTYGMSLRVGVYDPSKLRYVESAGLPVKKGYQYSGAIGSPLKDANGVLLNFGTGDLAYSANGRWMIAVLNGGGLARVDLDTLQIKVLAWDISSYSTSSAYTGTNNLAISDDGRFVAITQTVSQSIGIRPSLRVYDADTCRDQYALKSVKSNSCEHKDLWTGQYRTGDSSGLNASVVGAEYPRRVRFTANNALVFDTIHARTGATTFKVARYQAKVDSYEKREYVGVLGMGDSYISGEGAAGSYFAGTDTEQNKCHLSWFSYPYRVGAQAFPYGRSVACSGAKMLDVTVAAGDPEGLIKGEKTEENYLGQVKDKKVWEDRDRESIIATFSPGYANQAVFAREYKPRTVLLSIGGNDIGFSDIIKTCVDIPRLPDTCYQYYEDRIQVMQTILGQYDRLVATYRDIKTKSGGSVYVLAYPQVAKPGGNCGYNVRLDAEEVKFSAGLVTYLNNVIRRAAAEAGVYYVDTENALNGYRLCEGTGGDIAMNGLTAGDDNQIKGYVYLKGVLVPIRVGLGNESYHPNALGHKLIGQAVLAKTANLTAGMPNPTPNNKPTLDYNSPLLRGLPRAPEQLRHTEAINWVKSGDVTTILVRGSQYTTRLSTGQLQPNTNVELVIHSDPVWLYQGTYRADEQVDFTVPVGTTPGFHTLNVYGTSREGQAVHYRQLVYVAASVEDIDGDGFANEFDPCAMAYQVGVDSDADGIDDGCDGVIAATGSVAIEPLPDMPPTNPMVLGDDLETGVYDDGLFVPYVTPSVEVPVPSEPGETKPDNSGGSDMAGQDARAGVSNPITSGAGVVGSQSVLASVSQLSRGSVPNYFGITLTPDTVESESTATTLDKGRVLAKQTDGRSKLISGPVANVSSLEKGTTNKAGVSRERLMIATLLGLGVGLVAVLVYWRRRTD